VHLKILITLSLTSALLSGCAEGPSSSKQLATQGMLSGELSKQADNAVIGSVHHGGSYWDIKKKERLFDWNHKSGDFSSIRASAVSGNGKQAATCVEDSVVLWDTNTGKSLQFWQASDRILSIALNKDGSKALIGLKDGTVSYFDMWRGSEIHQFSHSASVRTTGLNGNGLIGISGSDDKTAKVWDLKKGTEIFSLALSNQIKTVAISDSGKLAFTTAQRENTLVWEAKTGASKFKIKNRYINYTSADFSDDEKFIIAGTFQGMIKKWNINTGSEVKSWQAKQRQAYGSAASKAIIDVVDLKSRVVALTSDGMVQVFK
jgi:WD40 repeat protein